MRVTIIVDDNMVLVDGLPQTVNCAALAAEGKHAVQWYGDYGEVEFKTGFDTERGIPTRPPNETITDFAPYQTYVDQWATKNIDPALNGFQPKTISQLLGV